MLFRLIFQRNHLRRTCRLSRPDRLFYPTQTADSFSASATRRICRPADDCRCAEPLDRPLSTDPALLLRHDERPPSNQEMLMALLYKADPVRGEQWKALFAEHAPDIEWRAWPDIGNPADIHYLAAWQAPENLDALLPNLKVLFALSAGVDQLDLSRVPPTLPV